MGPYRKFRFRTPLGDPALRRRLGEASRALYAQRFTAERMVADTAAVLDGRDQDRLS